MSLAEQAASAGTVIWALSQNRGARRDLADSFRPLVPAGHEFAPTDMFAVSVDILLEFGPGWCCGF